MSNKILIWSDLHIHRHKDRVDRLDDCLDVLEWIFEVSQKNDVKDIVFLGDLFHDRRKIDILTYHRTFLALERCMAKTNIPLTMLLGNHDIWHRDRWDISSVSPLRSLPGINVVESVQQFRLPGTGRLVGVLPFTNDPVTHLSSINVPDTGVLFAHLAVDGAILNARENITSRAIVEYDGDMIPVDAHLFSNWKQVFLGHYHNAQVVSDNIEYVGSPLQLDFGESFQHKQVCIFDFDDYSKTYERNTFSPQHLVIPYEDISKYQLEGNFVQVYVSRQSEAELMDLKLELAGKGGPKFLSFIEDSQEDGFSLDGIQLQEIQSKLSNPTELASKWLDLQVENGSIPKERRAHLMAMWSQIEREYEGI